MNASHSSRRDLLKTLAGAAAAALVPPRFSRAESVATSGTLPASTVLHPELSSSSVLTRKIPSSGEELPVVGLGTWGVFNVGEDTVARDGCTAVMKAFFESGGRLIDSSPMYGSSHEVIGYGLEQLGKPKALFSAEKVWIGSGKEGPAQMEATRRAWRVARLDLMQVHNLLAWEEHLPILFDMKRAGRIRYVGITTSHGRRHEDIAAVMNMHPIDFVQVTYNAVDREVDDRILPLARDKGIAVIVNRPFQRGALLERVSRTPFPAWAREFDCATWPELLLKFIVSHPAVTCAIPATSSVDHVRENLRAAQGRLPGEVERKRVVEAVRG